MATILRKQGQNILGGGGGDANLEKATYEISPATKAHSVGDYIYYNNVIYKVTSAIAINDTIAVGTNISADTGLDVDTQMYIDGLPGDSGSTKTTLTVTTTLSRLYGETISVTDGKEILTSTFSNLGRAIFELNNLGTYTITCDFYSTSVLNENHGESLTGVISVPNVSWTSGSITDIQTMVSAYYAGDITLSEIQTLWSIGDSRNVNLSAMPATGVGESHRVQIVEMVIIGFDHDTLTTPINNKTKALITIETKNCLRDASVSDTGGSSNTEHGYMNSSNTNVNGWRGCARRTWCNNVFYAALPSEFKALVKQANHSTTVGNQGTSLETTADYCFLPSEWEIFGAKTYAAAQEGTQYEYYKTASNRYKLPKWSSSYVSDTWWERSPCGAGPTYFCSVDGNGDAGYNDASGAYGLAPAACI